jgi:alpha-L-fucosidase
MSYSRFSQFLATLGVFAICFVAASTAQEVQHQADGQSHRTDWFHAARWGVFTHYMADTVGPPNATVKQWNAIVDGFDVEGLARQLKACGAGYYCITLGQNSGFYCSPNAAYDKYVGISPSKCSRRDLVADLYTALERQGVKLMVYLPSGAPDCDPIAVEKLQWRGGPHRNREFQIMWEDVIREWSQRWGTKVKGWWFDGCYFSDAMYRQPDAPDFATFAAAARAGNPESIVAFNPGVLVPVIRLTENEDYTAGEINDAAGVACPGRWLDGAQWHMLSYLGTNWFAGPKPRYTDQQVVDITRGILDKGGVVTWDVNIQANGLIPDAFYEQLLAVGKTLTR